MNTYSTLKHVTRPLSGGGLVLVLETGATIPPEAEAMLQALYSRDPRSVLEHLAIVAEKGPEKFMASYYVGYGHKSIGDCGTTTVFIEGVSMLVAKAIQDWALYSGQEVSTRYVDFTSQPFIDPVASEESSKIQEDLRAFYLSAKQPLCEDLKRRFPMQEGEKESVYEKAINARAFDILRGYLPAGASTSLAWHTNLRQAADHIAELRHHPLAEVQHVADMLEDALKEAFPGSFGHKRYDGTEQYNRWIMGERYYFNPETFPDFEMKDNGLNRILLREYSELFQKRPPKTELPKFLSECGTLQFSFLLDYGSFRDLQRHRAVTQRMPLLTMRHGFEKDWYIGELPESLRGTAEKLLGEIKRRVEMLTADEASRQYYIPMGYLVPCRITGGLPAVVYLAELRSGSTVHPTLQRRAQQMAQSLREVLGECEAPIYAHAETGRFDVRRGEQDIVKKAE